MEYAATTESVNKEEAHIKEHLLSVQQSDTFYLFLIALFFVVIVYGDSFSTWRVRFRGKKGKRRTRDKKKSARYSALPHAANKVRRAVTQTISISGSAHDTNQRGTS